ncbi:DUF5677 domain-containing protein [Burkholderia latens]|uniref:DUF5677 domain-containing protein n=1 Tax=Burkholderia latens TaxID=488446 RepID=UPI003C7D84CA
MGAIEQEGFLSPEIQSFRDRTRTRFADRVRECEEISRRATTQVFSQEIAISTVPGVTAASLCARCLSGCQAAILLAERGMGVDALALLRTAYENLFFSVALLKKRPLSRASPEKTRTSGSSKRVRCSRMFRFARPWQRRIASY